MMVPNTRTGFFGTVPERGAWHRICVPFRVMTGALETWAAAEMAQFCLILARVSGVLVALPLTWSFAPVRIRAAFALIVAFVLKGALQDQTVHLEQTGALVLALLSELAFGLTLGFVARLSLAIAEIAADAIAPAMGIAAAQMFDPTLGGQGTVLTKLLRYVAIAVALATGFHHIVLRALLRSFEVLKLGTLHNPNEFTEYVATLVSETLVSGVALALPFLAVLLIAQVALAFVARAAPQMQIFSVGFAVTLGVGTALWLTFAPDFVEALAAQTERVQGHLEQLLAQSEVTP
jgi:flagellar biosynthesis protein FliR